MLTAVVIFLSKYFSKAKENKKREKIDISIDGIKVNKAKKVIYFLFDFDRKDGVDTIYKLKEILQQNGYVVKTKAGHNYGEMKDYEFNR